MQVRNESLRVCHFPQLHDGCCFSDILSRFHEESGHFSSMATSAELFKSCPDLRSTVALPYRAGLVAEWLGPSANITPEVIQDKHSAWQSLHLDGEFSDDELVPIPQAQARPGQRKQEKMRLAIPKQIPSLRYCPQYISADFLKEGEPFWHQIHQIFGMKYCPIRGIRLVESDVSLAKRLQQYVPASKNLTISYRDRKIPLVQYARLDSCI